MNRRSAVNQWPAAVQTRRYPAQVGGNRLQGARPVRRFEMAARGGLQTGRYPAQVGSKPTPDPRSMPGPIQFMRLFSFSECSLCLCVSVVRIRP